MNPQTAAALAAALMTSACASSIQSRRMTSSADPGEGVSYYLPKRMVRVVIDRKEVTQDRTKLSNDLQAAAAAEAAAAAKAIEAAIALDAAKRNLQAAKDAGLSEEAREPQAAAEAAADLSHKIAVKVHERRAAEAKAATAKLNAAAAASSAGDKLFEETIAMSLSAPVPDTSQRFVARMHHNWSRSDEWKLNVTPAGLLTSANSNPSGQADEIFTEVAKTALALVNPAGSFAIQGAAPGFNFLALDARQAKKQAGKETECKERFAFHFEREFDPSESDWESEVETSLKNLCSSFRVTVERDRTAFAASGDFDKLCRAYLSSDNPDPALTQRCNEGDLRLPPAKPQAEVARRGLAYRRDRPVTFTIRKLSGAPAEMLVGTAQFEPHLAMTFMMPNASPVEVLPFKPSPVASQKMAASFENGMLTKAEFEKPGEGLAVAMVPANVIKGAFGLVGELLSLRIDNTNKQTQSLTAETNSIAELQKLLQAQKDLEQFKADLLNDAFSPDE